MRKTVPAAVLVATLIGPTAGQEPQTEARIGTRWFPASEILNPDGTFTAEFASPRELPRTGVITAHDDVLALGKRVAKWQRKSWSRFGRASDLGLKDGATFVGRLYCAGDMRTMSGPHQRYGHPEHFADWVAGAEALVEVEVLRISPGFNQYGEPEMLVTVDLIRHLFEPRRPLPTNMRLRLPVGEFVAGDAVFCRREAWGGYRPRVGDRLVVGTFRPSGGEFRFLSVDRPSQVLVVDRGGLLRKTTGDVVNEGFPATLVDLASAVQKMSLEGSIDEESLWEARKRARQRARADESNQN